MEVRYREAWLNCTRVAEREPISPAKSRVRTTSPAFAFRIHRLVFLRNCLFFFAVSFTVISVVLHSIPRY